ncbi:MAG: DUF6265 family protein [Bacteroidales bacterium]
MKKFILPGVLCVMMIFNSCQRHLNEYQLDELNNRLTGLQGTWTTQVEDGYVEKWRPAKDTLLTGGGYLEMENGLRQTEKLAIVSNDGSFSYLATVAGQNKGKTIEFPLRFHTDSSLVFINKEHDFPNVIAYYFISDTTLRVEVKSLTDPARDFELNLQKRSGDLN